MFTTLLRHVRAAAPTVLSALALLAAATPAAAQSDILLQLRSGAPLGDRLRVDSAGGIVAIGSIAQGTSPASGSGWRMMWYPGKVAFRAGYVDATQWDHDNVGYYSWAGGANTTASGVYSMAMGNSSVASGQWAIALGGGNQASGSAAFAAGLNAKATGNNSVAIGHYVEATGQNAVAMGRTSIANADYAVTIGHRAHANAKVGALVLADASSTDPLYAQANNQFVVRAAGGVRLFTNATQTAGVTLTSGGSSWNVVSDSTRKEGFADVDGEAVLAALRDVPVTTWRYRDEDDRAVRHIGPMAQDWHRAFGLNGDERTINMSDFDGVNLAAVRALEARTAQLRAKAAEVDALREEVQALRAGQRELERRLARLEGAEQKR
jgi:hypothetical protein